MCIYVYFFRRKKVKNPLPGDSLPYVLRKQVITCRFGARVNLLQFYLCTGVLESLLQSLGVSLGQTFLQSAGSTVNEILSLLQTQATSLLHCLNDSELVSTGSLQNNVEAVLLLSSLSSCTASGGTGYSNSCSSGLNSVLLFEDSSEFIYFLNGKVN